MDELSIFLAQLLGLYFLIAGIIIMVRRKSLIPAVAEFGHNRALVLVVALVELMAGLAIALAHPIWTPDWRGLITLIGWWIMIESVIYLILPFYGMRKLIRKFNTPRWYITGGFVSVVLGTYLVAAGFGFILS